MKVWCIQDGLSLLTIESEEGAVLVYSALRKNGALKKAMSIRREYGISGGVRVREYELTPVEKP